MSGLRLPVIEYGHGEGCSITGGYVYRGSAIPLLAGGYVYGDFCSGKIWALWYRGPDRPVVNLLLADTDLEITSFAQDQAGGLYALGRNQGVYRIEGAG